MQQIEGKTDAQLAEEAADIARNNAEKITFKKGRLRPRIRTLRSFAVFLLDHPSIDIEVPQHAINDLIRDYYNYLESGEEEE